MLRTLQHLSIIRQNTRHFVQVATAATGSTPYPYHVPRNTRGNLPVYTDVRNGGTRYLVMIRNVDGNANLLANDLSTTLFGRETPEASRMKIEIIRSKNLVISGGHWKNHIVQWLKEKGF